MAVQHEAVGMWWASCPAEELDEEALIEMQKDWDPRWGDRRQEMVFIGIEIDKENLISRLNSCLLNDSEMDQGIDAWLKFEDPFPRWAFVDE